MNDPIKTIADILKTSGLNIELTDELMANATGGVGGRSGSLPRFNVGDHVYLNNGNGSPITTEIMGMIIKVVDEGDLGWAYDVKFIKHPTDPGLINEGLFEWLLIPA